MGNIFVDHSLSIGAPETTYALPIPPTRAYEWLESSKLDHDPGTIQGAGLRQGSRFPRADRSVPGISRVTGSINLELLSKTFGLLFTQAFGTTTSTNVAGGLYQQVHTATTSAPTMPPFTAQEGIIRTDGTIEALTTRGCTVKSLEMAQPMNGALTVKVDIDGRGKHRYRTVADSVTAGTKTVTSATAAFGWNDVGIPVSGTNITAGTTIASVESATSVTLSAVASGSGSGGTLNIGTAYVTPTYASGASLYTSALPTTGALIVGGTLTAPTTTALASVSGGTTAGTLKSWAFNLNNGLDVKRDYIGGRGNPTTGSRAGTTLTLGLEYDSITGAMLADAQANGTKMSVLIGSQTPEQITPGNAARMQLAIASVRFDSGAFPQPTKGDTTVTTVKASVLDGLVAAQAVYLVLLTADMAA